MHTRCTWFILFRKCVQIWYVLVLREDMWALTWERTHEVASRCECCVQHLVFEAHIFTSSDHTSIQFALTLSFTREASQQESCSISPFRRWRLRSMVCYFDLLFSHALGVCCAHVVRCMHVELMCCFYDYRCGSKNNHETWKSTPTKQCHGCTIHNVPSIMAFIMVSRQAHMLMITLKATFGHPRNISSVPHEYETTHQC